MCARQRPKPSRGSPLALRCDPFPLRQDKAHLCRSVLCDEPPAPLAVSGDPHLRENLHLARRDARFCSGHVQSVEYAARAGRVDMRQVHTRHASDTGQTLMDTHRTHHRPAPAAAAGPALSARERRHQPRYTPAEAARYLLIPESTLRRWMRERVSAGEHRGGFALIASESTDRSPRTLSFVSLVAAHNIHVMMSHRSSAMGWPRVRAVAERSADAGDSCGLASRQFGTRIGIWPFTDSWAVPTKADWGGEVFGVEYDPTGEPLALNLPTQHTRYVLRVDPEINSGEASFTRGAAPLSAVRSRFLGGESIERLAADYATPEEHIAAALRLHDGDTRRTSARLCLGQWPLSPRARPPDAPGTAPQTVEAHLRRNMRRSGRHRAAHRQSR